MATAVMGTPSGVTFAEMGTDDVATRVVDGTTVVDVGGMVENNLDDVAEICVVVVVVIIVVAAAVVSKEHVATGSAMQVQLTGKTVQVCSNKVSEQERTGRNDLAHHAVA
jgi:hypothetical protein